MHRNPFTYRPEETTEEEGPEEWEDNAVSNAFAWGADHLLPSWCKTPEHVTSRIAAYFWTDCPCCLFYRGSIVGVILGVAMASIVAYII